MKKDFFIALEIRALMRHEYEQKCAEYRAHLLEQQQQIHNLSSNSLGLDHSLGEQVREQVRLAEEYDRYDDERRHLLLQQTTDSGELKRLINKLHTEGKKNKSMKNNISNEYLSLKSKVNKNHWNPFSFIYFDRLLNNPNFSL